MRPKTWPDKSSTHQRASEDGFEGDRENLSGPAVVELTKHDAEKEMTSDLSRGFEKNNPGSI